MPADANLDCGNKDPHVPHNWRVGVMTYHCKGVGAKREK